MAVAPVVTARVAVHRALPLQKLIEAMTGYVEEAMRAIPPDVFSGIRWRVFH